MAAITISLNDAKEIYRYYVKHVRIELFFLTTL
jgi:hypothetical protein